MPELEPYATRCIAVLADSPEHRLSLNPAALAQAFASAADLGMFSGAHHDPAMAYCRVAKAVALADHLFEFHFETRALDKGAYKVLWNLLACASDSGLMELQIETPRSHTTHLSANSVTTIDFPSLYGACSLSIDNQLKLPTDAESYLRIEFADLCTPTCVELVSQSLQAWARIMNLGGYAADVADLESLSVTESDCYLISPYRVEIAVFGPNCPLHCYDGLLNSILRIHRASCGIAGIELD